MTVFNLFLSYSEALYSLSHDGSIVSLAILIL